MDHAAEVLSKHHEECDALFAVAAAAVKRSDWADAATGWKRFRANIEAHISAEETVLFPAFESATGMTGGPTRMMRYEHSEMKGLFEQLAAACAASDADRFVGAAETLRALLQQHNMKEEHILYPMCNQALASQEPVLAAQVAAMLEPIDA